MSVGSSFLGGLLSEVTVVFLGYIGIAPSANPDPDKHFPDSSPNHGSTPIIAGIMRMRGHGIAATAETTEAVIREIRQPG